VPEMSTAAGASLSATCRRTAVRSMRWPTPCSTMSESPSLGPSTLSSSALPTSSFPHQLSLFEELARPYALFVKGLPSTGMELIDDSFWSGILGCSMDVFEGTTFLLGVGAQKNGGQFDPGWLDQPNWYDVIAKGHEPSRMRVNTVRFARPPAPPGTPTPSARPCT
jgi:hypothetical protein